MTSFRRVVLWSLIIFGGMIAAIVFTFGVVGPLAVLGE